MIYFEFIYPLVSGIRMMETYLCKGDKLNFEVVIPPVLYTKFSQIKKIDVKGEVLTDPKLLRKKSEFAKLGVHQIIEFDARLDYYMVGMTSIPRSWIELIDNFQLFYVDGIWKGQDLFYGYYLGLNIKDIKQVIKQNL